MESRLAFTLVLYIPGNSPQRSKITTSAAMNCLLSSWLLRSGAIGWKGHSFHLLSSQTIITFSISERPWDSTLDKPAGLCSSLDLTSPSPIVLEAVIWRWMPCHESIPQIHLLNPSPSSLQPWLSVLFIYIYAFSRRFYPKRLTVHSGYTFVLSVCVFPGNRIHNLCAANTML